MATKKRNIAELEQQLQEVSESRSRLAADYQNLQRRIEEQRTLMGEVVTSQVLEKLFPIIDNFYRASSHQPELTVEALQNSEQAEKLIKYVNGLQLLETQLMQTVSELGLTKIETKGQIFDTNLHEAISYEENKEIQEDRIIDEVEAGWMINERVVKPAKVRVSKG